jgi:hypothetical protein
MKLIRCRCPLCGLKYERQVTEWLLKNYELVYKTMGNRMFIPCDACRKKEIDKINPDAS